VKTTTVIAIGCLFASTLFAAQESPTPTPTPPPQTYSGVGTSGLIKASSGSLLSITYTGTLSNQGCPVYLLFFDSPSPSGTQIMALTESLSINSRTNSIYPQTFTRDFPQGLEFSTGLA